MFLLGSTTPSISVAPSTGLLDDSLSGSSKKSGISLKSAQFMAILAKRFHHHRRDYRSYLSQIVFPVAFMILAMTCTLVKPSVENMPSLMMTPDLYGPDSDMFLRSVFRLYILTCLQSVYLPCVHIQLYICHSIWLCIYFFRADKPHLDINLNFVKTIFEGPGIGTTCMDKSEMKWVPWIIVDLSFPEQYHI